ncbi:E3 ubiquitin-protein ligase HOS1 isoform X1 [Pistacia vera]|uniref:E3 ubiquitin-protein ligase HOS1 isoform X1 n=1 Tax=Pistacia vera TaxID=55513 RepID=UPI00126393AF|nr:E3 ubiquitin-protein ligase HOS1 isoform X1 [Pistacia vera]
MDKTEINGPNSRFISADCGSTVRSPPQHNYSSRAVQETLEHLASIDLSELCNEAKIERCRATRDLRSCGRYVQCVLNSCGHASLCAECSQRCDFCPICRIPIPKDGNRLRLRLYYECIEASLISKRCDERFQDIEDGENQLTADIQRLYSLFDIALENNLTSLICHYVSDVCMDEAAVSSDPVIAFLLDEVVIKDWCQRAFKNIIAELEWIYNLGVEEMKTRLSTLLKFSVQLAGISSVIEVLSSSFKDDLSAQVHDLHQLQESILKTKQHLEIMMWCVKHQFLEDLTSRYVNFASWRSSVRQRKSAATKRAWFDVVNYSAESTGQDGSLFIEDALANLEIEQKYNQGRGEELELASLHKDEGGLSFFKSRIEGLSGCYPFENLRAAVDILFLHGSSDLVVAKQAIFLYYLFDRHWTMPDENWRHIVDDFAATFSITRHSLLESLTFYLLDDHTDEALQEACHLLPEISGPTTHPKIARVLLERENPETALMVLRWSGRDGGSELVSLSEAGTAVRVRVECALLTEAFTYQRMLCSKVREKQLKYGPSGGSSDYLKGDFKTWEQWVEILVTEICCLCIRRNLVDRMIELPWNSNEEKHLHKCLLDSAADDPSTTIGSLLVVFFIQRYRYAEAYQVNLKLQSVEQDFLSRNPVSEEILSRMQSQSHWRTKFVDSCIELLPEVQQQLVKSGKLPVIAVTSGEETEMPAQSDLSELQEPKSTSLLAPTSDSSLLGMNHFTPAKSSAVEMPIGLGGSIYNPHFEVGNYSTSILRERLFTNAGGAKYEVGASKDFKFDKISTPGKRRPSLMDATPFRDINNSSTALLNRHRQDKLSDQVSSEPEQNGFASQFQNTIPRHSHRMTTNPVSTPSSNRGLLKDHSQDLRSNLSSKRVHSDRDDRSWNFVSSEEPMDASWSYGKKSPGVEDRYANANGGPRWRSDETSDEEEEPSPERSMGVASTPSRGIRRSRFARR